MELKRNKEGFRYLSIVTLLVICYILFAFTWWAILLYKQNHDILQLQNQLLDCHKMQNLTEACRSNIKQYHRVRTMIVGEGIAFALSLALAIWFIFKSYTKEIELARQANNFILSITHELKSPLASIQLATDTLRRIGSGGKREEEIISAISSESGRLNNLIEQVLLTAKLEQNLDLYYQSFDYRSFLEERVQSFKKMHDSRSFILNIENTSLEIESDKSALRIIVDNLLQNATKYSRDGTDISIFVHEGDDKIVTTIRDQGIGIPYKDRNRIFDRFFRVGDEETRKSQGTGLGLYICKKIVEAMDGKIWVEQIDAGNTAIAFSIPVRKQKI